MAALDINKFGALASPVTAKNGQPLTIAEYIAFDVNNEKTVKSVLDDLKNAIEQGGGSGGGTGGDITINDAILGDGLSFKNNKIELNLENYFKIENDTLGIKLGTTFELSQNNELKVKVSGDIGNIIKYGNSDSGLFAEMQVYDGGGLHVQYGGVAIKTPYNSGLKIDANGVCLNVDPNYFEIGSNKLKLKNPTSGGGGDYVLQEATSDTLGGIYIFSGVTENKNEFIIPICKDDTKEGITDFGLMVHGDGPFKNDYYLDIKPQWILKDEYRSDSYISLNLGKFTTSLANNINDKTIFGNKENYPGPRTVYFDNIEVSTEKGWPVTGKVSGHLVVNKSFPENATRYTHSQMLYITNSTGNEHKIFMRDGEGGFTSEGTELVSEWRPWKEIQGMAILQGSDGNFAVTDEDLNKVVDNGMYAGVYKTDDYTMDEENMLITGVETFTMIVVNNYAIAAVFDEIVSSLNMHFPKQIIQYKISSPLYGTPVANGSVDTPDPNLFKGKVQMRTGVYHDTTNTYVFTKWESVGGSVPIV